MKGKKSIPTVTIDTSVDLKRLRELEKQGLIRIEKAHIENRIKKIKKELPTVAILGHALLPARLGPFKNFFKILSIIGKSNVNDALILEAHIAYGNDYFVTNDIKDFIRSGRREKLERTFPGLKILTVEELERLLRKRKRREKDEKRFLNNETRVPKGWREVRLKEVAGVLGGFAFRSSWFNTEQKGFPVIKIQNLNEDGSINIEKIEHVNLDLVGKDVSKYKLKCGDILVAMTGATAGKVARLRDERKIYYLNQRVGKFYIKDKKKINYDYLYYSILHPVNRNMLKKLADGSAQGNMSSSQIEENLKIFLPKNINEQKRIADILSAFDEKIELNNKINETLEKIAQAVFEEWFVKFRFPGWEKVKFVDSELGKIPKGWEVKKLGEVARIEYGKGPSTKELKSKGYPVYGANGIIGYYEKYQFQNPQIIIGCRGVVGSVFKTLPRSSVTHNSLVIKPRGIGKHFLFYSLKVANLQSVVSGSAQPQITIRDLSRLLLVIPAGQFLNKFEELAIHLEKEKVLLAFENQILAALRDLLLPKLMSGEVRV